MTKVRQAFQISYTDVSFACAIYVVRTVCNSHPPAPVLFCNGPYDQGNIWGGSNTQLLAVRWLFEHFEYVYQEVGEMI